MFPRGNKRASQHDTSRGGRGRGQTRGAPDNSSAAASHAFDQERLENAAKREQRGQHTSADSRRGDRGASSLNRAGLTHHASTHNGNGRTIKESSPAVSNPFATSRSRTSSPFESNAPASTNPFAGKPKPSASINPFGTSNGTTPTAKPFSFSSAPAQPDSASVFGQPSLNSSSNVFAAPSKSGSSNPFGNLSTSSGVKSSSNPFASSKKFSLATANGAASPNPQQTSGSFTAASTAPSSSFGASSNSDSSKPASAATALPMSTKFGMPSQPSFASISSNVSSTFGSLSKPLLSSNSSNGEVVFGAPRGTFAPSLFTAQTASSNEFRAPTSTSFAGLSTSSAANMPTIFGSPSSSTFSAKKLGSQPPAANGTSTKKLIQTQKKQPVILKASGPSWALKLSNHLQKEGIIRPTYPGTNAGDPTEGPKVESFFRGPLKTYRSKVRNSFMRAGLMDDPDKPKKLSEAINFKGTCEDMCPFKEKFERIMEGTSAINILEKERTPTGALWPSLDKMVKKHSRSAAGDEEPLPEDVRSPAALRRCLDYLLTKILGSDEDLRKVHGFLWDRTRAIRRDFIFQAALSNLEMMDLIYCLEHITRFHVVALHQMSKRGIASSDFNEQQEHEQLSKSMISLMHAYDDCRERGIVCDNEIEFKAYHLVFNAQNPTIMEMVADLDQKFGEDSDQIIAAVNLVECMQTCWDKKGPLKAFRATELPHNAFCRFFCEVKSEKTWYVLACFAEVHFNSVRKAALRTILRAYRKQREQATDWTLERLQSVLNFDSLEDVQSFGEAHGVCFEDTEEGQTYLSFDSTPRIIEPFPRPKQIHSHAYVEAKRGPLTLTEVIDGRIHEDNERVGYLNQSVDGNEAVVSPDVDELEGEDSEINVNEAEGEEEEEEGLFVKDDSVPTNVQTLQKPTPAPIFGFVQRNDEPQPTMIFGSQPSQTFSKPTSVFDQVKTVQSFDTDFFTQGSIPTAGTSSSNSTAFPQPLKQAPSMFPQTSTTPAVAPSPFLQPSSTKTAETSAKPTFSLGNYAVTRAPSVDPNLSLGVFKHANPAPAVDPFAISSSDFNVTKASTPTVGATANGIPKLSAIQSSLSPSFLGAQQGQMPFPAVSIDTTVSPSIAPQAATFNPVFNTTPASSSIVQPLAQLPLPTTISSTSFGALGGQSTFVAPPIALPAASFAFPNVVPMDASTTLQTSGSSKRENFVHNVTNWYTTGEEGILPQWTEHVVENLLAEVFKDFTEQENARIAQEELAKANEIADEHRYQVVAAKFLERWRRNAHIRWVRRNAIESRKLRKEMYEASIIKRTAESANLLEDFRASTRSTREKEQVGHTQSIGNASSATGALDGIRHQSAKLRNTMSPPKARQRPVQHLDPGRSAHQVHGERPLSSTQPVNKRRRESLSMEPSLTSGKHRKSTVDDPLRRSLLDHPSYLNGESRIFYAKTWTMEDEMRERPSGTQTDYFRLKARGIHTMPDGSPLASSIANLRRKSSHEAISKTDSRRHSTNSYGRSISSKSYDDSEPPITGVGPLVDVGALKRTAQAYIEVDRTSRKRRSVDLDDEEDVDLAVRVKRLKEEMFVTRSIDLESGDRTSTKRRSVEVNEAEEILRASKKGRSVELNFTDEEIEILARAKRVKEQMDEGRAWYQQELERDSQERESRGKSRRKSRESFGFL